jgi:hypothetical protein
MAGSLISNVHRFKVAFLNTNQEIDDTLAAVLAVGAPGVAS